MFVLCFYSTTQMSSSFFHSFLVSFEFFGFSWFLRLTAFFTSSLFYLQLGFMFFFCWIFVTKRPHIDISLGLKQLRLVCCCRKIIENIKVFLILIFLFIFLVTSCCKTVHFCSAKKKESSRLNYFCWFLLLDCCITLVKFYW